jgi:hypothetical protein
MARFPFTVSPRPPRSSAALTAQVGSSREAASQLAESINRYWADLGYDAEAHIVEIQIPDGKGGADEFVVVSNLRNGVPARRLPSDAVVTSSRAAARIAFDHAR